jgi:hypothetical protein
MPLSSPYLSHLFLLSSADLSYYPVSSLVMNRMNTAHDTGYRTAYPEGSHVRGSTDVMTAVVGEVEAALKSLERERNTESVR